MHAAATSLLARAVGLTPIGRAYARAAAGDPATDFSTRALDVLDIDVAIASDALRQVPRTGPLVVVANHPSGALDGLVLLSLLGRVRGDVKLLGNQLLNHIPELRECLVPVDIFGRPAAAVRRNSRALRSALDWLEGGGCLCVFPAGEVAHRETSDGRVIDSPWHHGAAELAMRAGAAVVPAFIAGSNSRLFRSVGRLHPLLRTALLPRELWSKRGRTVSVRVGAVIAAGELASRSSAIARTALLRSRVDHLSTVVEAGLQTRLQISPAINDRPPRLAPLSVAPRGLATAIDANIETLASSRLIESGAFQVFCATAADLPAILPEIGRLRELTFRQVGEGTGLSRDLDRFDERYQHLFVWDRTKRAIAGAYRIGAADVLGMEHLYTRTLFEYDESLLSQIGPALELGRSFVQPDYQRDFSPLLLLWKGILRLVSQQPRYRRLFGVVSISDLYDSTSRQLLLKFLQTTRFDADLGRLVRAKNPPAPPRGEFVDAVTVERIEDVSALVRQIEPDGKDIPVLLRQYLKLNAKLLGFTLDASFGNVLDGLVVVDLDHVEPAILSRYMGKAEARVFLSRRRVSS
jgi:putative hemolysin